jgi:hypothetical protein
VSSIEQTPDPEVPAKARARTYSAAYKARILAEYESLDKAGKGAVLADKCVRAGQQLSARLTRKSQVE